MRNLLLNTTACAAIMLATGSAHADMAAAEKFLAEEIGGLSVLSEDEQKAEMEFFINAAKPFAGMEIKVVSETITTHEYEAKVLAPAFTAITGIKVTHDLIGEGDVVEKLQTQMQTGENIYDAYVNDSDLIGTHWRYQQVRNLTDWMAGEGADVTSPTLDVEDFIGTSFTTGPDGKLYQLPTQQFANLYWFRYDWFNDEKNKADFKAEYGYDLGVPVNWSAYEDIAAFFTGRDLSHLGVDGDVYGNMDYGKKDPSLGWRYTDAWMSMAGMGDVGEPNGLPVDEWGIRVNENSQPVGSCVTRGGATNSPAAVYAVEKAIDWLKNYSPPAAAGMTFGEAGPIPAQGNVAQQMFWYTAFTAAHRRAGPAGDERGWHAEVAHGTFAAWRLLEGRPEDRLSGRWFLDADEVDPGRSCQGRLALRTVRHLQDGRSEEVRCRSDLHP
jgi:glycerol transport system substrate-binding protein